MRDTDIAIIGLACRFPKAESAEKFWQNLRDGVEGIHHFSDDELLAMGVDPALLEQPNYVKANGVLDNADLFDAQFFGYTPREAEIIDPQQRIFLECAQHALDDAAIDPQRYTGLIGVYGGASLNSYLLNNLASNPARLALLTPFEIVMSSDKDFLTTRASYKLNLTGPSFTVQTACSTSLVATHLAMQALLNGECDVALAGGVSVSVPQNGGYLHQAGMIFSADGHCRAFDADATGTVNGNGVGIVVLKRLEEAWADGDHIYAVIKGSAINNDGATKVGYTAPSIEGQTAVIQEAQAIADVEPETISYIETHGTGTALGDPIEIAALTQAFGTNGRAWCALGAVKSNIGHTDAAAGVAGVIKTALALRHGLIPPSLHFATPNPNLNLENSPFFVNDRLRDWQRNGTPRRAGVSSFGIGGTNAHLIMEEAPQRPAMNVDKRAYLLPLSAKNAAALDAVSADLATHLQQHPDQPLCDIAYTLTVGRTTHPQRRIAVVQDGADAIAKLTAPQQLPSGEAAERAPAVVFMFGGNGTQHRGMGCGLYASEPTFRAAVDQCAVWLQPRLNADIRNLMWEGDSDLGNPLLSMTAVFTIQYALAQLWMSWGIEPQAVIGHSFGEYAAACVAGVFSLEDALTLTVERGRLCEALPAGRMLSVLAAEETIRPILPPTLAIAAVNTPDSCVVSGCVVDVEPFGERLSADSIDFRPLAVTVPFHSVCVDPLLEPFAHIVKTIRLNTPQLPLISSMSGEWVTATEITDPSYWVRHLRDPVRFADGLTTLFADPNLLLLEAGPGRTLSSLAKRHPACGDTTVVRSMRHPQEMQSDEAVVQEAIGRLWMAGVEVDWEAVYADAPRRRVSLPGYPFQRQRYWVDGQGNRAQSAEPSAAPTAYERPQLDTTFAAAISPTERAVAEMWQQVLGIEQVGIHDDFFELGGHSLMGTQIINRIRAQLGVALPLNMLFNEPTIARLAVQIDAFDDAFAIEEDDDFEEGVL